MAIHGYSTCDAWSALAWCRLHHRKAILLSDSKYDDMPRLGLKEWVKQRLVSQYDAALCAGKPHRAYLQQLGMKSEQTFEGFDVVDNDFFWRGAEQRGETQPHTFDARLESPEPFFLVSAVSYTKESGWLAAILYPIPPRPGRDRRGAFAVETGYPRDGPERNALENLVRSEGIQGVSFPGFLQIEQLPIYYGLASLFYTPSHQDTWGWL